jgi:hypothetical protein
MKHHFRVRKSITGKWTVESDSDPLCVAILLRSGKAFYDTKVEALAVANECNYKYVQQRDSCIPFHFLSFWMKMKHRVETEMFEDIAATMYMQIRLADGSDAKYFNRLCFVRSFILRRMERYL